MPAPVIAAGIGGVSSLVGGALAGRSKQYTQTMTPSWSPEMQDLQKKLSAYSSGLLTDPAAGTAPIKANAEEAVNRRYAAMPDVISRSMAARGYGSSGNFGNTMYESGYRRSGELSDINSQIAQLILQQRNTGASLADRLLEMTRSTTSTGNTPSTAAADAFMSGGNALSNISTLLTLSKLLKGNTSAADAGGIYDSDGNYIGE
jgi:hypothetical protein